MRPFKYDWELIDEIEAEFEKQFRRFIYKPIKKIFEENDILSNEGKSPAQNIVNYEVRPLKAKPKVENALPQQQLIDDLKSGKVQFWANKFTGQFSATTSKELFSIGAQWRFKMGGYYYLPYDKIPGHIRQVIDEVRFKFVSRMEDAEKELSSVTGDKVAAAIVATGLFLKAVNRSEKDFQTTMWAEGEEQGNVKDWTDFQKTSRETREQIAKIWENNMAWNIKKWTDDEVKQLRSDLKGLIFQGKTYGTKDEPGDLDQFIYDKYGARIAKTIFPGRQLANLTDKELQRIQSKATFLARNEVSLLMTTYKYVRSKESGADYFRWVTVVGTPDHPVRPSHLDLKDKIWAFDDPPLDWQLERKVLPGEAYNCRCSAIPIKKEQLALDDNGYPLQYSDGSYILA